MGNLKHMLLAILYDGSTRLRGDLWALLSRGTRTLRLRRIDLFLRGEAAATDVGNEILPFHITLYGVYFLFPRLNVHLSTLRSDSG